MNAVRDVVNDVEVCPNGVWALIENKAQAIHPDDCMGCGNCVESCPNDCIKMEGD